MLWGLCFETPPFVVQLRGGTEDFYGLDGVAAQYGMLLNERGVPTTVVLEPGGARLGLLEDARCSTSWRGTRRALNMMRASD